MEGNRRLSQARSTHGSALGMPVHRHRHSKGNTVYAFPEVSDRKARDFQMTDIETCLELYKDTPTLETGSSLAGFTFRWFVREGRPLLGPAIAIFEVLAERRHVRNPWLLGLFSNVLRPFLPASHVGWNDYHMGRWQLTGDRNELVEIHRRCQHIYAMGRAWSAVWQSAQWMTDSYRRQNPSFDLAMKVVEQNCGCLKGTWTTYDVESYGVEHRHALPINNFGYGTTLYGHAKKQELFGNQREQAERGGYLPYNYQAIKWFTLLYLPIIPLGTYRVMKERKGFWTLELAHCKVFPVAWDWTQVLRHYLIAYGWAILLVLVRVATIR